MDGLHVNPELFKGEIPQELLPKTYYAYLDSVEKVNGTNFLRFDCIEKNFADNTPINKESIVGLPSIVIDISAPNQVIDELFGISGVFAIYNYESQWMQIETTNVISDLNISEFFNFAQVGNPQTFGNYSISSIKKENDLDSASRGKIKEIKSATRLTESTEQEIFNFIQSIKLDSFSHVNVYNVGQGNCNALVDSNNIPLLYFDIGGGSGANARTYPAGFKLCHSLNPFVILSHWDLDHIVTAVYDKQLLNTKWLVPVQVSLSNTAIQIALDLQRRGNLVCWNNSVGSEVNLGHHFISKCTARSTNKNSSGLTLYVNYGRDNYTLLPGDATFDCIPNITERKLIGMVASHHGAKSSIRGLPVVNYPGMLAYSYGLNNTHGHAHCQARNQYAFNGWVLSLESLNGNIALFQNPLNMNSPCNSMICTLSIDQHF